MARFSTLAGSALAGDFRVVAVMDPQERGSNTLLVHLTVAPST